MKTYLQLITLICLIISCFLVQYEYYSVDELFSYLDNQGLEDEEYQEILEKISKIFANSYAFYDISKNPPQPFENYHSVVDIQKRLKQIETHDINSYEFYRRVLYTLSDLKDPHIRLFMEDFDFKYFYIVGPFEYYIKEHQGKQRLFVNCEQDSALSEFEVENNVDLLEFCLNNEAPVKSINNLDPFEYLNNFGGNFVASKNVQGTFSYKMIMHNEVSLNDYPMTYEEFSNLQVVFDDEDQTNITTKFIFASASNLYSQDNYLRSLRNGRGFYTGDFYKNRKSSKSRHEVLKRKISKNKNNKNLNNNKNLRNLSTYIQWDYSYEQIFKCYVDVDNGINLYYVGSFEPDNREEFINILKKCVNLFDKNKFPIVVLNEFNTGGYMSLTQLFMGVLSPLVPINLFKGRLRVTEALKETKEVSDYINSNLVNIKNCEKASFNDLVKEKVKVDYSETYLTQIFYITNKTIHDQIEDIRKNMKNKRKPTEILIFTDGYSLSSAGLYIKYLQKMGGAFVAGYNGNPYSDEVFDSSQSPSGVFISSILGIFNPEENKFLNQYNILLEISGVQTFYNLEDKNVPLEYEITPVDLRLNFYHEFNDETYTLFIQQFNSFFHNIDNLCYSSKLIKFDENVIKVLRINTHMEDMLVRLMEPGQMIV